MYFVVMVVGLEVVDDMLPVCCQDVARSALEALVDLLLLTRGVIGWGVCLFAHVRPGACIQLRDWGIPLRRKLFHSGVSYNQPSRRVS